jgi:phosphonate transport system permease protein
MAARLAAMSLDRAASRPEPLPSRLISPRARAALVLLAVSGLVGASFCSLDLQWRALLSRQAVAQMARFAAEFIPPDTSPQFVRKVALATAETWAMSALGTLLAALAGLLLALPAARSHSGAIWRIPTRMLLNALRAVPELVWASLMLIAAGLGPMAGTLALALHTTGVLGRLFAEAIENTPPGPAFALRAQGARPAQVLLYATLPQVAPQLLSYTLYRWENNIRAASILGVVGAGGLGQLLSYHLGLFQMGRTATVLLAMLALVLAVDAASYFARRAMTR